MTHDEANAKHWEPIFEDAIHKIASCNSQIYSKLIMGLQAERDLFERKCEDMAAELAALKQRKMATEKMMTKDFWLGLICGFIVTFIGMSFSFFIEQGWIK